MSLLSVKNLTYSFSGARAQLFDGVSFAIDTPGITCITGKNGVGKSTLFRLLQGQLFASGVVSCATKKYDLGAHKDRASLQKQVKMMQQKVDRMLAPSFTVQENLQAAGLNKYPGLADFGALNYTLHGYDQIPLDKPVSLLSGGQKQIIALLMCLQQATSVLLLDEPTAALDENNARYFMDFVHALAIQQNMVVVCISHDSAIIERFEGNGILHLEQEGRSTRCQYL